MRISKSFQPRCGCMAEMTFQVTSSAWNLWKLFSDDCIRQADARLDAPRRNKSPGFK